MLDVDVDLMFWCFDVDVLMLMSMVMLMFFWNIHCLSKIEENQAATTEKEAQAPPISQTDEHTAAEPMADVVEVAEQDNQFQIEAQTVEAASETDENYTSVEQIAMTLEQIEETSGEANPAVTDSCDDAHSLTEATNEHTSENHQLNCETGTTEHHPSIQKANTKYVTVGTR